MSGLITRFINEMHEAEYDVGNNTLVDEHDGILNVSSSMTRAIICIAVLCTLPCLFYLYFTIKNPSILNIAIALLICPPLVTLSSLVIFGDRSRAIDSKQKTVTTTFKFLSFKKDVLEPIAPQVSVNITWKWQTSHSGSTSNRYFITMPTVRGINFSTTNDYPAALHFAERLAALINVSLENNVQQDNRH